MAFGTPTAPGTWHHAEDAAVTSSAAAAAASSSLGATALAQSSSDGAPSRQCAPDAFRALAVVAGRATPRSGPCSPEPQRRRGCRSWLLLLATSMSEATGLPTARQTSFHSTGPLEAPSCTVTVVHKPASGGEATAAPAPTPAASVPDADQTNEPRAAIVATGTDVGPLVDEADQQAAPVLDDQAAGTEEPEKENGMGEGGEDEAISTVEDDVAADGSCRDESDMELMTEGLDTL